MCIYDSENLSGFTSVSKCQIAYTYYGLLVYGAVFGAFSTYRYIYNTKHITLLHIFNAIITGFTGGSGYHHVGAAVDPLCLPRDPEWGVYKDGINGNKAYVYGAEYETNTSPGKLPTLHQHDIPCAVCLLRNRSVVKMFPGETDEYFY